MSEKKDPRPTSDADQDPERVEPRLGLARLKKAMRQILRVPKENARNATIGR